MFLYVFAHFCLARSGIFQGFSLGQDRANPETMPNKRMYPMKSGHDRERASDPIFGRKTDAIHRLKLGWSKAAVMVTLNAPKDRARIATAVPKPTGQWTQMPNLCSGQPLAHQDPADPCTLSTTTCAEYLRSWNAVGTCDEDRGLYFAGILTVAQRAEVDCQAGGIVSVTEIAARTSLERASGSCRSPIGRYYRRPSHDRRLPARRASSRQTNVAVLPRPYRR